MCPAIDLPHRIFYESMTEDLKKKLETDGIITTDMVKGVPWTITKDYVDDSRENNDIGGIGEIMVEFPVTIVQGKKDEIVPWETARELSGKIDSPQLRLVLLRDAEHRFHGESEVILNELKDLIKIVL